MRGMAKKEEEAFLAMDKCPSQPVWQSSGLQSLMTGLGSGAKKFAAIPVLHGEFACAGTN